MCINLLKESEIMKRRWELYRQKYDYANNISYNEIIHCIEEIIKIIVPVVV